MKRRISRFTILELISVIIIGGVLVTVLVPSFISMMKGSGYSRAARELMGKISAARSYAVSHRTYVAIVFPISKGSATANGKYNKITDPSIIPPIPRQYRLSTYRVCEVRKLGATWEFKKWIAGEGWNRLPESIYFMTNKDNEISDDAKPFRKPGTSNKVAGSAQSDSVHTVTNCDLSQVFVAGATKVANSTTTVYAQSSTISSKFNNMNIDNCLIFNSFGRLEGTEDVLIQLREASADIISGKDRTFQYYYEGNNGYIGFQVGRFVSLKDMSSTTIPEYSSLLVRSNGKTRYYEELQED